MVAHPAALAQSRWSPDAAPPTPRTPYLHLHHGENGGVESGAACPRAHPHRAVPPHRRQTGRPTRSAARWMCLTAACSRTALGKRASCQERNPSAAAHAQHPHTMQREVILQPSLRLAKHIADISCVGRSTRVSVQGVRVALRRTQHARGHLGAARPQKQQIVRIGAKVLPCCCAHFWLEASGGEENVAEAAKKKNAGRATKTYDWTALQQRPTWHAALPCHRQFMVRITAGFSLH